MKKETGIQKEEIKTQERNEKVGLIVTLNQSSEDKTQFTKQLSLEQEPNAKAKVSKGKKKRTSIVKSTPKKESLKESPVKALPAMASEATPEKASPGKAPSEKQAPA